MTGPGRYIHQALMLREELLRIDAEQWHAFLAEQMRKLTVTAEAAGLTLANSVDVRVRAVQVPRVDERGDREGFREDAAGDLAPLRSEPLSFDGRGLPGWADAVEVLYTADVVGRADDV